MAYHLNRYHQVAPLEAGVTAPVELIGRLADTVGVTIMRGLYFASEGDTVGRAEQQRTAAQAAKDRQRQAEQKTARIVAERREQQQKSS